MSGRRRHRPRYSPLIWYEPRASRRPGIIGAIGIGTIDILITGEGIGVTADPSDPPSKKFPNLPKLNHSDRFVLRIRPPLREQP